MLLLFVPKIKIEICHQGTSATGQRKGTLNDRRAGRVGKPLCKMRIEVANQRMLFPEPAVIGWDNEEQVKVIMEERTFAVDPQ